MPLLSVCPFFLALLLLLHISPSRCLLSDDFPIVNTEFGPVRGQRLHVVDPVDGQPVALAAFLGVPFARPPLGQLRFEKPLKPEKWSGVLNASQMAPACWPIARAEIYAEPDQLSEDCLYMNIFVPEKSAADAANLAPVLIYIHGGGFQAGTIRQFKTEAIAKFVRRGLLFVTIQYRLAMLGFAATDAPSFAGNYGLWDQAMALQFLHENLRRFGGDPSLVTLWGFSAGASSVAHLTSSPHTNGLFKHAFQQSGNALVEWAANDRVVGETKRLAQAMGCGGEESADEAAEALKQCLRQKTPEELMDGIDKIGRGRNELNFLQFNPRYDGDFFPADFDHLLQNAPPKRTILGVTSLEALTFTLFSHDPTLTSTQIPRAKWANFSRADLEHFVEEKVAPQKFFGDSATMAQQRILQFYGPKNGDEEKDNKFWLTKYNELITDTMFAVPMLIEAEQKMAAGWPIYLYQIEHINSGYPPDIPIKDCFHCIELGPLFGIDFPYKIENATEADKHFQLALIETITSFTKSGAPQIHSLAKWRPTDRHAPSQYALFSSDGIQMKKALASEKLVFWRQLSADFPYDIITGIKREKQHEKDEL